MLHWRRARLRAGELDLDCDLRRKAEVLTIIQQQSLPSWQFLPHEGLMEDTDLLQGDKPVTPLLPLSGSQALPLLHLVSNSCLSRYALNQVQQPPNLPQTPQLLVKRALSYEVLSNTKDPSYFRWRGSRTHVLDKWLTASYYAEGTTTTEPFSFVKHVSLASLGGHLWRGHSALGSTFSNFNRLSSKVRRGNARV